MHRGVELCNSNAMDRTTHNPASSTGTQWAALRPVYWLFDSNSGPRDRLGPRGVFFRALAAFYFSAFLSLLFQIEGMIGPHGILPAQRFLEAVQGAMGPHRFWYAPTLFWLSASEHSMMVVTWLGLIASVAAFCNLWPRLSFFVCFACFLSFV